VRALSVGRRILSGRYLDLNPKHYPDKLPENGSGEKIWAKNNIILPNIEEEKVGKR